jgi:hypothetical protein
MSGWSRKYQEIACAADCAVGAVPQISQGLLPSVGRSVVAMKPPVAAVLDLTAQVWTDSGEQPPPLDVLGEEVDRIADHGPCRQPRKVRHISELDEVLDHATAHRAHHRNM